MGDVIALAVVATAFAAAGGVAVARWWPRTQRPVEHRGAWHRVQEGAEGNRIRVSLVREHKGREIDRMVIAEIEGDKPGWDQQFLDAAAEADYRLRILNSEEGK